MYNHLHLMCMFNPFIGLSCFDWKKTFFINLLYRLFTVKLKNIRKKSQFEISISGNDHCTLYNVQLCIDFWIDEKKFRKICTRKFAYSSGSLFFHQPTDSKAWYRNMTNSGKLLLKVEITETKFQITSHAIYFPSETTFLKIFSVWVANMWLYAKDSWFLL